MTRVSRQPFSLVGWIGVVSWMTRRSLSINKLQGWFSVNRWPLGVSTSKTRVSPPLISCRLMSNTATQSTPSRCAPSGVGRPIPSDVSIRNWWTSLNQVETSSSCVAKSASQISKLLRTFDLKTSGFMGLNQRCIPPCNALYVVGCQCALCGTVSIWFRVIWMLACLRCRYLPPSFRYSSITKSSHEYVTFWISWGGVFIKDMTSFGESTA